MKRYDPDETEGTRVAREARSRANSLSREERDQLLREGMAIIYGDPEPQKEPEQ